MFSLANYYLKSSFLFENLSLPERNLITEKMARSELRKGQVLFRENTYPKGVYIVRKGKIKIFRSNPNGGDTIVYIYKKGDFFGYRPLLAEDPQPVSAAAMDNAVVSFIPRDAFIQVFNHSEGFAKRLAVTLAKEFSVWINKMTIFTQYSVKERVALSLLILNEVYRKKDEKRVIISINRDDLASFVGTAKESLVRNLRHFKDEKIISTQGTKITVLRPEALHNYL